MTLLRSLLWLAITAILVNAWTAELYAHGGGLDAYGCHNNRKTGGYHCHRGPFAGESFGSKDDMLRKQSKKQTTGTEEEKKKK